MKNILLLLLCFSFVFALGACPVPQSFSDCDIEVLNKNGIYVIKVPKGNGFKVYPYVTKSLSYNKDVYNLLGAKLVVNAGYFDANNKSTASFVVVDGKVVLDPRKNQSLMSNNALLPHLDAILNRSEFRVLSCSGKVSYDITSHYTKPPYRCKIIHSIQAGPMLYPNLRMTEEYFVEKDFQGNVVRDSIHALKKCARTAIGIKDGDIYIIIADIYHKLTLPELHKVCEELGLDKAINFDGGGSTSLNYKDLEIVSDKNITPRKVKSFLVVE